MRLKLSVKKVNSTAYLTRRHIELGCVKLTFPWAFKGLRNNPGTTNFFLDLLAIVKSKLLRMLPSNRVSCGDIVEIFEKLNEKCLADENYCTIPVHKQKRADKDLSELMATPIKQKPQPKRRLTGRGLETMNLDHVDDGLDRSMELVSSPKQVHFVQNEDLGIGIYYDENNENPFEQMPAQETKPVHINVEGQTTSIRDFANHNTQIYFTPNQELERRPKSAIGSGERSVIGSAHHRRGSDAYMNSGANEFSPPEPDQAPFSAQAHTIPTIPIEPPLQHNYPGDNENSVPGRRALLTVRSQELLQATICRLRHPPITQQEFRKMSRVLYWGVTPRLKTLVTTMMVARRGRYGVWTCFAVFEVALLQRVCRQQM